MRVLNGKQAIAYGGLVIGALDAIDAIVFFGLRSGATPVRIFQSIAAGLLGRATYQGGLRSALLGVAIHFFIAFSIAATYYAASRRFSILSQRPILCGAVYGVLVYFFMNRVVIPLSAIGSAAAPPLPVFINGITIHILGVGIPAALFAARGAPMTSASAAGGALHSRA